MAKLPLGVLAFNDGLSGTELVRFASQLEEWGYESFWIPEVFGREPLATAGYLLARTARIRIATGIAVIWVRDPVAMAQARRTLAELAEGRFALGIGVSHPALVEPRGHTWSPPVERLEQYLDAMEKAELQSPAPAQPAPLYLAAHGPKLLQVARERCDGAFLYLVPPERARFARERLGTDKELRVVLISCLCEDADTGRRAARRALSFYLGFPAYHRMWRALGYEPADWESGGSDRLVDALIAWGGRERIGARIRAHLEAGADQVLLYPLAPADRGPAMPMDLLEALAPG